MPLVHVCNHVKYNQFFIWVIPWWRHQMETFPCYWPFVRGIHQSSVNSPHKGMWREALMFSLICAWVNMCITNSFFPTDMKLTETSSIFKKNDKVKKITDLIISCSKLFKNIMCDQITGYFSDPLCSSLSAYRKRYCCQRVILRLTEYWRQALDAMDLSRAFGLTLFWMARMARAPP